MPRGQVDFVDVAHFARLVYFADIADFADFGNPPRPLASRRVEALNQDPNPPNLQNLKQAHKGEGLPSPYHLPTGPARRVATLLRINPDL